MGTKLTKFTHALTSRVRAGDTLVTDGGFTCLLEGSARIVEEDVTGLFIRCGEGRHYLDGQLSDDGTRYIGLRKPRARRRAALRTTTNG